MTKKHEVTITWGTEAVRGIEKPIEGYTKIKYKFNTESELDAFIKGVDEGNGWLEYEVQDD
tara:strand:+ start:66 stop:248 length:183 start_codon:yes stop_codon:yes gene_type:complete